MRLLLDTHAFLWFVLDEPQLSAKADAMISDPGSDIEVSTLHIEPKHTALVSVMPFHHRDPFDRLIVAQALVEQIAIVSSDSALDSYGVTRYW